MIFARGLPAEPREVYLFLTRGMAGTGALAIITGCFPYFIMPWGGELHWRRKGAQSARNISCFVCGSPMEKVTTLIGIPPGQVITWWCRNCEVSECYDPGWYSRTRAVLSLTEPGGKEIVFLDHSRGHYPSPG